MKLWERAQPSINIGLLETPPDHAVRATDSQGPGPHSPLQPRPQPGPLCGSSSRGS